MHRLDWRAVEALLDRLKLDPMLLDRLPDQISGGELQRFAIARALLLDPIMLFADEATSRLDPISQKEVVALLMEIVKERKLALLFVTHDSALADKIADRTIVFSDGQVQTVKSGNEVPTMTSSLVPA